MLPYWNLQLSLQCSGKIFWKLKIQKGKFTQATNEFFWKHAAGPLYHLPGSCKSGVFIAPSKEVKSIHSKACQCENFCIKSLPACSKVNRNLKKEKQMMKEKRNSNKLRTGHYTVRTFSIFRSGCAPDFPFGIFSLL